MGLVLLLALAGLQAVHFSWLYLDKDWITSLPYRMVLFTVAPAFFLYSQPLLQPRTAPNFRLAQVGHLAPILAAPLLPARIALPAAFVVGAGYLLWLAHSLAALRRERASYRTEIVLLGGVFLVAVGASILGLAQTALPEKLFFGLYAIAIGIAFCLVQVALGRRPQLPVEVRETVQAAYAQSTLNSVDCGAVLSRLDSLMVTQRIYTDPALSLPGLAERVGISAHQLSELLNTRLGKGFSRYLRERRIAAAKVMLCEEPSASVLSVGLSVGFTSQSNFYEAFRELESSTPGLYRKLNAQRTATP